jgi:hypothetical protein
VSHRSAGGGGRPSGDRLAGRGQEPSRCAVLWWETRQRCDYTDERTPRAVLETLIYQVNQTLCMASTPEESATI